MSRRILFDLPYFDAMENGEVSLGVPIIDGAIQIGIPESEKRRVEKGRLKVVVGEDKILIARAEPVDLQFEVPVLNQTRVKALGEGASQIALGVLGAGEFVLNEDDLFTVNSVRSIKTALWTVSDHALGKQEANSIV